MRSLALAILAVACVATPVLADAPPTMDEAKLAWKTPPSVRDLVKQYPRKAAMEKVAKGSAKVHCTARANGAISCVAAEQSPENLGFGDAAVGVMRRAKVRTTDGGSPEGRQFVFSLKFGNWTKAAQARLQPLAAQGLAWATPPSIRYEEVSRLPRGQHKATVTCATLEEGALDCQVASEVEGDGYVDVLQRTLAVARVRSTDGSPVAGRRFSQTQSVTVD